MGERKGYLIFRSSASCWMGEVHFSHLREEPDVQRFLLVPQDDQENCWTVVVE